MQISKINNHVSNMGLKGNAEKISKLEQKNASIMWASEGCNGSLNSQDAHELDLRREYQALQNKHIALQWASEGCNASLSIEDMKRMSDIEAELIAIEPKTAPIANPVVEKSVYDVKSGNIYGVPDSTFWGDWTR